MSLETVGAQKHNLCNSTACQELNLWFCKAEKKSIYISIETAHTHSLYKKSIGFQELSLWSCQELLQSGPFEHTF